MGGHERPSRCPYRRVFLRRIVRLGGRGLLFQASVERMLPLRARIALCAACSVGDQVHKIFVPGRHFDVIDLGFDAAGYVIAMLLVLLTAALVRHATRPIGAHARR
ncbi:MAG: VanZ family protein [Collinsella sp.]